MDALHEEALQWFEARSGEIIPWPEPMQGSGLFLMQRAKGIHKPKGWHHALSVRVIPTGRYPDEDPVTGPEGTWTFRYHQEESAEQDPAASFTNLALERCMLDGIPVGVVRQVSGKPSVRYRVLGLARVTAWDGGFFTLTGPARMSGEISGGKPSDFGATSIEDARATTLRAIRVRQGQATFRSMLLAAYQGRCAVSGCSVEAVLEAAHIIPYLGEHTNVVENGLLLRADLHTLFDLGHLWIDPSSMTVVVGPHLTGSTYEKLAGRRLRLPIRADHRPSPNALASRVPRR